LGWEKWEMRVKGSYEKWGGSVKVGRKSTVIGSI